MYNLRMTEERKRELKEKCQEDSMTFSFFIRLSLNSVFEDDLKLEMPSGEVAKKDTQWGIELDEKTIDIINRLRSSLRMTKAEIINSIIEKYLNDELRIKACFEAGSKKSVSPDSEPKREEQNSTDTNFLLDGLRQLREGK